MKSGWLAWHGKYIEWKHHTFVSPTDLRVRPHFELTVTHKQGKKTRAVTFNNIELKTAKLKKIDDFTKLPEAEQGHILNKALDAWEKEYASAQ